MSFEEIRRKNAETRLDRDKKYDAAIKEIKDRKANQLKAKKNKPSKAAIAEMARKR